METKHAEVAGKQKTVSINRVFNLPIDKVWKAWSEPESFKKWWGPTGFTCPYSKIDFKVGGKNHSSMKSPEGQEIWSLLTYREIVPKKKIVYDDEFADSKGNAVQPSYYDMPGEWSDVKVTVTFEDLGDKTRMTMQQTGIPEKMYDDCITGWQQCFDKLENNLK